MLDINLETRALDGLTGDLLVAGVFAGETRPDAHLKALDQALGGLLLPFLASEGFERKMGEWLVIPTFGKMGVKKIGLLGLGAQKQWTTDRLHEAGAHVVRRAREVRAHEAFVFLPRASRLEVDRFVETLAEGVWLGAYQFHAYRPKPSEVEEARALRTISLCGLERKDLARATRGLERARALAQGVILARDLVNTPAGEMTPQHLVDVAKQFVMQDDCLSLETLDADAMEKLGMHPTLAVGRGSQHAPQGVHLVYHPTKKTKKRIALIGKAITFDSGGLSLKPADQMMTMKSDMAGAAAILGLFHVLPALGLPLEVHGIFLAAENMPSGKAYRPGDVVRAMNGKTIEVLNTDAEGRLTLADALCYGATFEPDAMIDVATLTGAAIVALGDNISALLANDRGLAKALLAAAQDVGETTWELPLFEPYQELIKSRVAELKNIGNRTGGAITAALFLSHFVNGIPWAHIDIAGPSFLEKETRPDWPLGGTGVGVRLLASYLQTLS